MNTIFNPELLQYARNVVKQSFVDPATATGGGGAPPPAGDPMAGAMPPMPPMGGDPAAAGGDPAAAAGAAPPAAPEASASAAPAGVTADEVKQIVQECMATMGGGAGGAGGAMGKPMKPKIDVNTEIYQIKKLLVMMAQEQGMPVPASLLLGDPAMDPAVPQEEAAKDPFSAAATQNGSAINPIQPLQGASQMLATAGGGVGGGGGGAGAGGGGGEKKGWDQGIGMSSSAIGKIADRAAASLAVLRQASRR